MNDICSTKADTLQKIAHKIRYAEVLPQYDFTVSMWQQDKTQVMKQISRSLGDSIPLCVRSSCQAEDLAGASLAGRFTSCLNIIGKKALRKAIEDVVKSYDKAKAEDQVLIQPMLQEVTLSGVAFTRDPNTGGEYYVINYMSGKADTTAITSGKSTDDKTYYHYRGAPIDLVDEDLQSVVQMLIELEDTFGHQAIDVEFAAQKDGTLVVLQVRPLKLKHFSEKKIYSQRALEQVEVTLDKAFSPHPYLFGESTVFGNMPDWNPAEIIGVRPKPLAMSLYQYLITDSTWAYQRHNYGYKNLRSFPLMVSLAGMPYIDVRVSFNSFIPDSISESLANKLVNYYISRLLEQPEQHDKVEFNIIFSAYTLDLPQRLASLSQHGFTTDEIQDLQDALRKLTNNILHPTHGLWITDVKKSEQLKERYQCVMQSELSIEEKIFWLLEDCKRYGCLPFAGLARAGFIAIQMLDAMVAKQILSASERSSFLRSLSTISKIMSDDLKRLQPSEFLRLYGHLRPGTYDILSPRYDESPERYFHWNELQPQVKTDNESLDFRLSLKQLNDTDKLLKENGLQCTALELFNFIQKAIEGREYTKFMFSKHLSKAIALYKDMLKNSGFTVEQAAYSNINVIAQLKHSSGSVHEVLKQSVELGQRQYSITERISLPSLISDASQIYSFHTPPQQPNYITLGAVTAETAKIPQDVIDMAQLKDKILFIENADPGYDWIFSKGVAGFITAYGGCNSHMAIRAGELGLPAVIGAGENNFNRWCVAKLLRIDCANQQVQILK